MKAKQPTRSVFLIVYIVFLFFINYLISGRILPSIGSESIWFYAGMAMLILGTQLIEPYFTKPVDAISNVTAALIVLLGIDFAKIELQKSNFVLLWKLMLFFYLCILFLALFSIAFKDINIPWLVWLRKVSEIAKRVCGLFGNTKVVFSIIFFSSVYWFYQNRLHDYIILFAAWLIIVIIRPIEKIYEFLTYVKDTIFPTFKPDEIGIIIGLEKPALTIILINEEKELHLKDLLLFLGENRNTRIGLVIDIYFLNNQRWAKVLNLEVEPKIIDKFLPDKLCSLLKRNEGKVFKLGSEIIPGKFLEELNKTEEYKWRNNLVGFVVENSNINRIIFEVTSTEEDLAEGRIVKTKIKGENALFQIVDGYTKSEILEHKNRRGFIDVKARKIGIWNREKKQFDSVEWLPKIHSPVYLEKSVEKETPIESIGKIPNSDYFIDLDTDPLVTHNTAILGILGIGKTFLVFELIAKMVKDGIKVICLDITGQYKDGLKGLFDLKKEIKRINTITQEIAKTRDDTNQSDPCPEGGGNKAKFMEQITADLKAFLKDKKSFVKIYNPERFNVTKQAKVGYRFLVTQLTTVQITRIITESLLKNVQDRNCEKPRVCIVFEEAHSLIPEWTSTSFEGDQIATNGTAKAILQGRKYGLGCLIITQRTANVIKSVLNQCNTVFAMRVFDATGMEFLKNYIGEEYANVLPSLKDRHSILFGRASSSKQPIIIQLNDREKFLRGFFSKVLKE